MKALIVRINSPGGTITASDVIYREIREFKARRKIPVIAAIVDVGASGGYYVALAADQILAHPTSVTGSIGVVMLTLNAQGLLEKIGVAPLAIKSGAMKDAGSPFRQLTPEERAVFQGVIDEMFTRFVGLIVEARKIPAERVRGFADGRIYTAEQAREMGLVDRLGYMDDAIEMARKAAGLTEARVVMYHRPREYRTNYYSTTPSAETALTRLGPAPGRHARLLLPLDALSGRLVAPAAAGADPSSLAGRHRAAVAGGVLLRVPADPDLLVRLAGELALRARRTGRRHHQLLAALERALPPRCPQRRRSRGTRGPAPRRRGPSGATPRCRARTP